MRLNVYDMDGTIIDSEPALRKCRIEGLVKATGGDYSQLEKELMQSDLGEVLKRHNIDADVFFHEHYNTFDPYQAVKDGTVKVFNDAISEWASSDLYGRLGTPLFRALISNSTLNATKAKLNASGIERSFAYVLAEIDKAKAKPTPYMAKQLVEELRFDSRLDDIDAVKNVGDNLVDMEFGEVLYETIASAISRKPSFKNYLIDRENKYEAKPGIVVIHHMNQMYKE